MKTVGKKAEGMHIVKNKRRPRAVRVKRKGGVKLYSKRRTPGSRAVGATCGLLVVALVGFGVASLFRKGDIYRMAGDYGSIVVPVSADAVFSPDEEYDAVDVFGRLNYKFAQQKNWYAQVQGTVHTMVGDQDVKTFKQYNDGILISADITRNDGLNLNAARQFCYIPSQDRVVWREAAGGSDTYNGIDTPWSTGKPSGNMYINYHEDKNNNGILDAGEDTNNNGILDIGFKATHGLPATELSVYVIDHDTVESAEPLVDNGNGTYSIVYHLDPQTHINEDGTAVGAPVYYANQMMFTGNLTGLPQFDYITVTYTFDSSYRAIQCEISESYTATMGITTHCTSTSVTKYQYDTPLAESNAYEQYFFEYMSKPATGETEKTLDALGCLGQAFGPLLAEPTVLDLDLNVNGQEYSGSVYLELNAPDMNIDVNKIKAIADLGTIKLWMADGEAYLIYGNVKVKLSVQQLLALLSDQTTEGEETEPTARAAAETGGASDPLSELAKGEFTPPQDGKASLQSVLHLGGIALSLDFDFLVGEDNVVTLDKVAAGLGSGTLDLDAVIRYGEESPAEITDEQKAQCLDLTTYAGNIAAMANSGSLRATVSYQNGSLTVGGTIDIGLKGGVLAAGTIDVQYGTSQKSLGLVYKEESVYLDLDGIKVKANVSRAIDVIESFLKKEEEEAKENGFDLGGLVLSLLNGKISQLLTFTPSDNSLQIAIAGTELLEEMGLKFALGTVTLNLPAEGVVTATGSGLNLRLEAGEGPAEAETADYIDLLTYVEDVQKLLQKEQLHAYLSYGSGDLSVLGRMEFSLDPVALSGSFRLAYKETEATVGIGVKDGYLYLDIAGVKIKADTAEAVGLVKSMLNVPAEASEENKTIEKLLALDFGDVLELAEENGELRAVLQGTTLLRHFIPDGFDLGEVALNVNENGIVAHAKGAEIIVSPGTAFTTDTEDYIDFSPVMSGVVAAVRDSGVSIRGALSVHISDTAISLDIKKGMVSWKNGLEVYLDATLTALGTQHDVTLSVVKTDGENAETTVKLVYGNVGVEYHASEAEELSAAFQKVVDRLNAILSQALEEEANPETAGVADLTAQVEGLSALFGATESFDFKEILSGISVKPSPRPDGLLRVTLGAFTGDLLTEEAKNGILAFSALYSEGEADISGELHATAIDGEIPAMPEVEYLGKEDFIDLFDYVGAAVALIAEQNVSVTIDATVHSEDEKYKNAEVPEKDGVKYEVDGRVDYYSGGDFPFKLLNNGSVYVNNTLYLHLSLGVAATLEEDTSLYLDVYVLDGSLNGVLDFYVSASAFPKEDPRYDPLTFHAPADEIMTLLSGVCAIFGVDADVIDNALVSRWLDAESVAQLRGLGGTVKDLLGSALGFDLGGILNTVNGALGLLGGKNGEAAPAAVSLEEVRHGFIESIKRGENTFTVTLENGVSFTIAKTLNEENESILSQVTVSKVASGTDTTDVSLNFATPESVEVDRNSVPAFRYDLDGFDRLLIALAKSATHAVPVQSGEVISGEEEEHEYVLNSNFYITGNIAINVNAVVIKVDVNVRLVAVSLSIDENGAIGVNIRLEYDGVQELNQVAINGDSSVDITIKNNMVYMKRVQTSKWEKQVLTTQKVEISPITLYRATTLSNFTADILDHMVFIFNLGDAIQSLLPKDGGTGDGGGGTEPQPEEKKDFGEQVSSYVKSYVFTEGEKGVEGDRWDIAVNGATLTNNVLEDLAVTISSDRDGYIRDLTVNTSLYSVIKATANLRWRNPGSVMESGVTVQTNDIGDQLERDLSLALAQPDWEAKPYIEAQYTTVTFNVDGNTLGEQNVAYDLQTGELYTPLKYPSLENYMDSREGYTPVWPTVTKVTAGEVINANFVSNKYDLVFESDMQFDGATQAGEKWTLDVSDYAYGSDYPLPAGKTNEKYIDYWYYNHEGKEYRFTSIRDTWGYFPESGEPITFTAHWAYIEYTVTFDVNGTITTQKGHYGDDIEYPTSPSKLGYHFLNWTSDATEITGDVQITAVFAPDVHHVTLVSDHAIEFDGFSFTLRNEGTYSGKYVAEFDYTYDTFGALPSELRTTDADGSKFFLNGFVMAGEEAFRTSMPNILADTVFTASWTEVGSDVRFRVRSGDSATGEEILVATRNFTVGTSSFENLPEIPEKKGYTGEWVIPADFVIEEKEEGYDIYAKYTPVTYYFTAFSAREITGAGWGLHHTTQDFWEYTFEYVYDSEPIVDLGTSVKTPGYDFGGFWTQRLGSGEQITRIDNSVVELFNYNVGNMGGPGMALDGRNILYAYWVDNTVTARLYSDVNFEGSEGKDAANGYYTTISRNDVNYNIGTTLKPTGNNYLHLGWWYRDPDAGWRSVTSLEEFYDRETFTVKEDIALYAFWVTEVEIRIDSVTNTNLLWYVGGTATGGELADSRSQEIATSLSMTKSMSGVVVLFRASGDSDRPNGAKSFEIQSGERFNGGGTSANFLFDSADKIYGGVTVTLAYTYTVNDEQKQVLADFNRAQSGAEYTVVYHNVQGDEGETTREVKLRLDAPYVYNSNPGYPSVHIYNEYTARSLAEKNGIEVAEREGYTRSWPNTQVSGNMDVYPTESVHSYSVAFVSEKDLGDERFAYMSEGEYVGKWVYITRLQYGATVLFSGFRGSEISSATITVPDMGENGEYRTIVINVPDVPPLESGKTGSWASPVITAESANFTAIYDLDTVVYHSDVAFEGTDGNGDMTVQYDSTYTLIEPVAEGYVFLGWYETKDETWTKAPASVEPSSAEAVTYRYEALWMKEVSVTVNAKGEGFAWLGQYKHNIAVVFTGGELYGAPKANVRTEIKIAYAVNNSETDAADPNYSGSKTLNAFPNNAERSDTWTSNKGRNQYKYAHADVTITLHFGEEELWTSGTLSYHASF